MTRPTIHVFAGPNGSGKSTITVPPYIVPPYINADKIKIQRDCSDLEAAKIATEMREKMVRQRRSFTFETVLSTPRNLDLLRQAELRGYFIRGFFVLTVDPQINVYRVKFRVQAGGHDVPARKIIDRYYRSLAHLPELYEICDELKVYDNSLQRPECIFAKETTGDTIQATELWSAKEISRLVFEGLPPKPGVG